MSKITLNDVRLSYVHVFSPRITDNGGKQWSLTILLPKTDTKQVEAVKAAIASAKEANKTKLGGTTGIKSPLLDGDAKDEDGNYKYGGDENRGHYLIRAANYSRPPVVVDADLNTVVDPNALYSGCYGNVHVNFYAYNVGTNKGIAPGLEAIQKTRDGESLGGTGVKAEDVFSKVATDDLLA